METEAGLVGWKVCGDEDCAVWLICPWCKSRNLDTPMILVPNHGYTDLLVLIETAAAHVHTET